MTDAKNEYAWWRVTENIRRRADKALPHGGDVAVTEAMLPWVYCKQLLAYIDQLHKERKS